MCYSMGAVFDRGYNFAFIFGIMKENIKCNYNQLLTFK